jgi:rare lipoprotein A (peptidoglycan hydrolase)
MSFALCCAGILVGSATANAAACPNDRHEIVTGSPSAEKSGKHDRAGCVQAKIEKTKTAKSKTERKAERRAGTVKTAKAAKSKKIKKALAKIEGPSPSLRVFDSGKPVPKGGGYHRIGVPYVIAGRKYTPQKDPGYRAEGKASWYGKGFHGRRTANGEIFDMHALSAAHPTLPLPSYVRVTNLENNKSLIVRVNDRGPFHGERLIDVSVKTAKMLDFYDRGVVKVRVEYVGEAKLDGSDNITLAETARQN